MNITLLQPAVGKKPAQPYPSSWIMEPLSLGVLAAHTPPEHTVTLIDDRIEPIPFDRATDIVGISVETYTAARAYEISRHYRSRGVPVVMGGYHPTLLPAEVLRHSDAIVTGPAEMVWPTLLTDFSKGNLKKSYAASGNQKNVAFAPDRRLLNSKKYPKIMLVESGRGCPQHCSFCSVAAFYSSTHWRRPLSAIMSELEHTAGRPVFFVDDNIISDPSSAKEFFSAIKSLRLHWIGQASIKMANDPDLCRSMKESGCMGILIGFESLNPGNLARMGKSWNSARYGFGEAIHIIHDHGLAIYATFMFGYDNDTVDSIRQTVEFAISAKFFLAAFNHVVPFPGTPLYRELEQQQRLLYPAWWLDRHYRFGRVAFRPAQIDPELLAEECFNARRQFFGVSSIIRRFPNLHVNFSDFFSPVLYFIYNFTGGRQAVARQDLPLGNNGGNVPCT